MTRNFWHYLDTFPPILIRLLARDCYKRHPLGTREIVARSGLNWVEVERLSWATSWKDVDVISMRKFLTACNVDFCNHAQAHRIDSYLRSAPTWKYLRGSKQWLSLYQPMILKWKEECIEHRR